MSPEERAEQLVQLIARGDAAFDKRGWIEMPKADRNRYITRSSEHLEAIAQAIREAEDAVLERAAAIAEAKYQHEIKMAQAAERSGMQMENSRRVAAASVADLIEMDIRSLKSKEI